MSRIAATAILISLAGGALGCASSARQRPEPPTIYVTPVSTGDLALHLHADGLTRALARAFAADSTLRWVPPGLALPPEAPDWLEGRLGREARRAPAGAFRLRLAVDRAAADTLRIVWALFEGPDGRAVSSGVSLATPTEAHAAIGAIARHVAATARERQPGISTNHLTTR